MNDRATTACPILPRAWPVGPLAIASRRGGAMVLDPLRLALLAF